MKKIKWILPFLLLQTNAFAYQNGGPSFIYDSSGNALTSTAGALNVSFGMSTFAVTQSTSPWITQDQADGSATGGTAGSFSLLTGGIYNTSLPTLTNGQQAGFQVDSSGRLIIRPLDSGTDSITVTGTVTANAGTGNFTVIQPTGSNLHVDIDNFPGTQPISGTVNSLPVDGTKATYSAVITGITPASSATDLFTITGSGTKIVRIRSLTVYGSQTTGGVVPISLIKRSSANTGGTSSTASAIAFDSTDPSATATVQSYTANPTTGTAVGILNYDAPFVPNVIDQLLEYGFSYQPTQVYTLNSASELLAVNLNANTVTGGSFTFKITWTEE